MVSELERQKEAVEKELANVKKQLKEAQESVSSANPEEIAELNGQISVMQEVIDSNEVELKEVKKELESVKTLVSEKENEVEMMKSTMSGKVSELEEKK